MNMAVTCNGVTVSPPCPKERLAKLPAFCRSAALGNSPAALFSPGASRAGMPKAKALRGIQNCLPAQQLAQRNKVTVTALFQRAAQVDGAVRRPSAQRKVSPAVWMLPVQS